MDCLSEDLEGVESRELDEYLNDIEFEDLDLDLDGFFFYE